jgi:hypothetical protein
MAGCKHWKLVANENESWSIIHLVLLLCNQPGKTESGQEILGGQQLNCFVTTDTSCLKRIQ